MLTICNNSNDGKYFILIVKSICLDSISFLTSFNNLK